MNNQTNRNASFNSKLMKGNKMSKPSKKIWFLFLILFLLASIFPPWDHPRIRGIKFSLFYEPPDFADTTRGFSVNDSTYTPVSEGRLAWKLLHFEYFVLVISCISLWMIEGKYKERRMRSSLTKTQNTHHRVSDHSHHNHYSGSCTREILPVIPKIYKTEG